MFVVCFVYSTVPHNTQCIVCNTSSWFAVLTSETFASNIPYIALTYKLYFDLDLNENIPCLNIRNVQDISSINPICELNYIPPQHSVFFAPEQFFPHVYQAEDFFLNKLLKSK